MAMLTTFFAYWLLDDLGLGLVAGPCRSPAVFGLVQGIVVQQIRDPPADRQPRPCRPSSPRSA